MNDALITLQDTLIKQHKRLREALGTVDTDDQRRTIIREMFEITHRIQLAGGLLFAAQSQDLDAKVAAVRKGTAKIKAAIDELDNLQHFLDTMSSFIALVDEAIDLAKSLML